MINKYVHVDCIVRKVVTDEGKMRSLLKFSAEILFEIISVRTMNFVGSNSALQVLPSLVVFIR